MPWLQFSEHQRKALAKMHNGCVLCGGVGSGKSRTALAYYYTLFGGNVDSDEYVRMSSPKDLYIITTAKKRDSHDWEGEMTYFLMMPGSSLYSNKVVVDSWNNIKKYSAIKDSFFIFDEQRVVGYGAWTKSFLEITKSNKWILLSATPGDRWEDYIPIFVANGFFKNKTEFVNEHLIISYRKQFPEVVGYTNTRRLIRLRDKVLVDMPCIRTAVSHRIDILVDYDRLLYKEVGKNRKNIFRTVYNPILERDENPPIKTASEMCYVWRRIVNSDPSRLEAIKHILENHQRIIVFYNYDYELDILKNANYGDDISIAEWNGHHHDAIPKSKKWIYLVQYNAGAEGWNCIDTDTIVFYSNNYSYKVMEQARGRIDRLNTPFKDLNYFVLKSSSKIDLAISAALKQKKNFNEGKFK